MIVAICKTVDCNNTVHEAGALCCRCEYEMIQENKMTQDQVKKELAPFKAALHEVAFEYVLECNKENSEYSQETLDVMRDIIVKANGWFSELEDMENMTPVRAMEIMLDVAKSMTELEEVSCKSL